MKIDNLFVYGLPGTVAACGLPFIGDYDEEDFQDVREDIDTDVGWTEGSTAGKRLARARQLASCPSNQGHDNFLCGIVVQMNVTAPRYWWPEFQRYHFIDIVSSTSTMHRLPSIVKAYKDAQDAGKLDICEEIRKRHFSENTDALVVSAFMGFACVLVDKSPIPYDRIKSNLPEGYLQTARITTNYRQLKTIYLQRKNHPLKEWTGFCDMVKRLPMAAEYITGANNDSTADK